MRDRWKITIAVLVVVGLIALILAKQVNKEGNLGSFAADQERSVSQARIQEARAAAKKIWGKEGCHGQIGFAVTPLKTGVLGKASYRYIPGSGPASYSNCVVLLGNSKATYAKFCSIMAHELGHLLGKGHNKNPRSIMYYKYNPQNTPKACKTRR